ncbi:hypothetical protein AB3S75_042347 [Citrus x aurantiifolia]
MPWLCFGDFNEVLNLNEKLGGKEKSVSMVNDFRETIRDRDLRDLGVILVTPSRGRIKGLVPISLRRGWIDFCVIVAGETTSRRKQLCILSLGALITLQF